jgi:hypothetical protein
VQSKKKGREMKNSASEVKLRPKRAASSSIKVKFDDEIPYVLNQVILASWNGKMMDGKVRKYI